MTDPLLIAAQRINATPQTQPIVGRPDMIENAAGGFTFEVDEWTRLHRFLILGTQGGTYYVSEQEFTQENVASLHALIQKDHARYLDIILEIDSANRAPRRATILFALALACAADSVDARRQALAIMPQIVRTGSDLMRFVSYLSSLRGWGRSLRRGIGAWYDNHPSLALQVIKYRNRYGYTHRDLLRLAHPSTQDVEKKALYEWICRGTDSNVLPDLVQKYNALQAIEDPALAAQYLRDNRMPQEAVRSELQGSKEVLEALAWSMPVGALLRNLSRLTAREVLHESNDALVDHVCDTLVNGVVRARVHPINVLAALNIYKSGRSMRSSLTWKPLAAIIDALDDAFYAAFGALESISGPQGPKGKIFLALDVSGSMCQPVLGLEGLMARDAAAAMAMCFLKAEDERPIVRGFSHQLVHLPLSSKMRLDNVISEMNKVPYGMTDCSLPIEHALKENLMVSCFIVITDNESYFSGRHPAQALKEYREKINPAAKMIVMGTTGTRNTIADPKDSGMLDMVGFDSAVVEIAASFMRGEI